MASDEDDKNEDEVFEEKPSSVDLEVAESAQAEEKNTIAVEPKETSESTTKDEAPTESLTQYDSTHTLKTVRCQVSSLLTGARRSLSHLEGDFKSSPPFK